MLAAIVYRNLNVKLARKSFGIRIVCENFKVKIMNTILVGKDCNGTSIQKGDTVFTDDGRSGEVKAVWDNGTVDIIVDHSHQGPVVDTFDIEGRQIVKLEELELKQLE